MVLVQGTIKVRKQIQITTSSFSNFQGHSVLHDCVEQKKLPHDKFPQKSEEKKSFTTKNKVLF